MAETNISSDGVSDGVIEDDTTKNLIDDSTMDISANAQETVLTKSQLKKLKKKEKWAQVKTQKRKAEKERQKARKKECRERGEELGPSRKQLSKNKMENSSCKIKVAIDCDFDDYMAEKDIRMLVKQIQFSYSANRRAVSPMQFYCCGVSNKTKQRLESLGDYKGWDIYFHAESFLEMFGKSSAVYLSSESPNVLHGLEEDKVYIIGGLVDHNHHKGLCHKLAEEKGLAHAQLPISEYIDMKTRKVLTINHVFEILLRYTESKDWQKAFYTVLPQRKGAVLKSVDNEDNGNTNKHPEKVLEKHLHDNTEESLTKCNNVGDTSEVKEELKCDKTSDMDEVSDLCGNTGKDNGKEDTSSDSVTGANNDNQGNEKTEKEIGEIDDETEQET